MNWKKAAEEDLRKYNAQKQSLENIPMRIKSLSCKITGLKSGLKDAAPVKGSGISQMENNLIDNIAERERLKETFRATKNIVALIERGLSGLTEQEKLVLTMFYIKPQKQHVERLMEELCIEQAQVYRIKDRALYKFTITMYGLIDY